APAGRRHRRALQDPEPHVHLRRRRDRRRRLRRARRDVRQRQVAARDERGGRALRRGRLGAAPRSRRGRRVDRLRRRDHGRRHGRARRAGRRRRRRHPGRSTRRRRCRGAGAPPLRCALVTAVLFTCAGQRVDIVTAFRLAGATTIAADVDPLAPALYHADRRALVPRVDEPGYVDALRDLVGLHDVRLVIPLTDLDHLVLAEHREELGDAIVLVPEPESIHRCADKYLAHLFFEANGIGTPPTWLPDALPETLRYPVLVKARR